MFILHLALGGCLRSPPVRFGITADTGGHIAYVLDAAIAQGSVDGVEEVSIVTRLFEDGRLDAVHGCASEIVAPRVAIRRIATANRDYLEKEALAAELPAFTEAFCAHLAALPRRPDVIHAHFADAAGVAAEARRRFGIPFIYTPHALGIDKRAQRIVADSLDRRIADERAAIADADAIIVSTRDEAERQIAAYGVPATDRIHCLPPGVPHHDGGAARLDPAEALDHPERPIILAIARPVAKKNLAALVRAYAETPGLHDRANLVILAGQHGGAHASEEEEQVRGELADLCADPRLAGRVWLPPHHDTADVSALYRRAAAGGVFVNPALHEPFGLTLIEAAAAGVPVVATRNGGPGEIVATIGHGLLVDPRDEAAIGAACLAIVADPARHHAFATAARDNAHLYCWTVYAARTVALYASLRTAPRLLACDIDNTLTGCAVGARDFARWRAMRTLPFVVATGRDFDAARAVLERWRLPEPDAFIVDVGTRIMLSDASGGWREWSVYADMLDRDWDRAAVERTLAALPLTPQPDETAGPHKISFYGPATDADAIRNTLDRAGLAARVVFSHDHLIDVLAPHAGKAAAIAAYAARNGFSLSDCIAAGDSGNDVDMLEACGRAIVVGNAGAELDGLTARSGSLRVAGHHAGGVMEGLAAFGCVPAPAAIAVAA